jgi:hypothetical protein
MDAMFRAIAGCLCLCRHIAGTRAGPRREFAPFLKAEAVEHLGANAKAFGKKFDLQVRALAEKGLSIRAIARVLKVSHTTVLKRSKRRYRGKPHR